MRSRSKRVGAVVVSGFILATALGYVVGRVRAAGIPTTAPLLTYSGTLTDAAGAPLTGSKNIQVQLWAQATGGAAPACVTPSAPQTLVGGTFQLALPDACVTAVRAGGEVWTEVLVDGASLGRTKIGAVPYAIEADRAQTAAGALTAAAGSPLKAALDVLQSHDVGIFYKGGNNGTVSCDTYCTGDPWAAVGPNGNGRGTCVGAYRRDTLKFTTCSDNPAAVNAGLACWCSQPTVP